MLTTASMMLAAFLLLFLLNHQIKAADFYITTPWELTLFTAGQKQPIAWNILPRGPEIYGINIDLMDGDDEAANYLANIASNLPPDTVAYEWDVPKTIQNSDRVFVRITGITGGEPIYRYSHRFMITGGEGQMISVTGAVSLAPPPSVVQLRTRVTSATTYGAVVSLVDPNAAGFESTSTSATSTMIAPTLPTPSSSIRKGTHRGESANASSDRFSFPYVAIILGIIAIAALTV